MNVLWERCNKPVLDKRTNVCGPSDVTCTDSRFEADKKQDIFIGASLLRRDKCL